MVELRNYIWFVTLYSSNLKVRDNLEELGVEGRM
jgi:hypothetical protein